MEHITTIVVLGDCSSNPSDPLRSDRSYLEMRRPFPSLEYFSVTSPGPRRPCSLCSLVLFLSCSIVSYGTVPQDRFRKLVESDDNLNKWCSVPKVVDELVSKEVRCDKNNKNVLDCFWVSRTR